MTKQWKFKVVKSQRGGQGEWFYYPAAATFEREIGAHRYASQFAASQREAGVTGTRIVVMSRRQFEGDYGPTNFVAEYKV